MMWLTKQVTGTCATRVNMSRIQDLLDDKCPNCRQPGERASHLNVCPDPDRVRCFEDLVATLDRWLNEDHRTEPELAYWIPKYLLMRGRDFARLGPMSPSLQRLAASQDLIGWREFLEGRISNEFRAIQTLHCASAPRKMNGDDWIKGFSPSCSTFPTLSGLFETLLYMTHRGGSSGCRRGGT